MSTTVTYTDVIELYVAMFQRAPEREGANYWYNLATTQNMSKDELANAMFNAAVGLVNQNASYQTIYPQYKIDPANITMEQAKNIIENMYKILFNKSYLEDPTGIDYWAGKIANDKLNVGFIVTEMVKAARNLVDSTDPVTKNAALSFVNKVQAATQISQIITSFDGDFTKFQNYIKNVNQNSSTIDTAIQTAINDARNAISNMPSNFTTGADNITGTIGDDIFFAKKGTLDSGDSINAGYGNDVLIAELDTMAKPIIKYVEEIQIISKDNSAKLDLDNINNIGTINKLKLDVLDNNGEISGISSASTELLVTGSNQATFSYKSGVLSGSSDSVKLTLENATGTTKLIPNNTEEIETLNVVVGPILGSKLQVQQGSTDSGFRNINVSGDGKVTDGSLKAKSGENFTLNMSGLNNTVGSNSNSLDIDLNGAKNVTITGSNYVGSGSDVVENLKLTGDASGNVSVNTGKGKDKVTVDSSSSPASYGNSSSKNSSVSFNLGDGNDELVISQDLTVYGNLTIDLGAGDNTVSGSGKVKLDSAATGYGNLTVTAGAGKDNVKLNLIGGAAVSGKIDINLGDGGDSSNKQKLELAGDSGTNSTVSGKTTIATGSGVDEIKFTGKIQFSDDVTITTGNGDDTVDINTSDVAVVSGKAITINPGNASTKDTVKLTPAASTNKEVVVVDKARGGYVEIENFDPGSGATNDKIKLVGFTALSITSPTDYDFAGYDASSANITDFKNTTEVLQKLNNKPATTDLTSSGNSLGNDDNILVLTDTTDSYIYYYQDVNGNNLVDTGDTLKLLAVVKGQDLVTSYTQSDIFTT